jgi:hypothetical protein
MLSFKRFLTEIRKTLKNDIEESWDDRSWSRAPQGVNSPLTYYSDTEPKNNKEFKIKLIADKDPHGMYYKHQRNIHILNHLSKAAGEHNQTNTKMHYENQLRIAARKKDWWVNQKFTEQPFEINSIKHTEMNKLARHDAMTMLKAMGHNVEIPENPRKNTSSEVVQAAPKTADGRIQFGINNKGKDDVSSLQKFAGTKVSASDKPRIQFGVTKK